MIGHCKRWNFLATLCAVLLTVHVAVAAELQVDGGLRAYQVLQRNAEGSATAELSGKAGQAGSVQVRVMKQDEVVLDWKDVAEVSDGSWRGTIEGIPTGGEYRVELRLRDGQAETVGEAAVEHVLVGDIWVLAGQSNMQGVGNLDTAESSSPLVHSFDMADEWVVAEEPLHALMESVDPVHWRGVTDAEERAKQAVAQRQNRVKGTGLGLPFAKQMVERTGVPVGLVPCAHGGTSMDQWNPEMKTAGGDSLYGAMIRRIAAVGGRVKGLLWYQGESDANAEASAVFADKFEGLIAAVRADVKQPELPFYYVQLGRFVNAADPAGWHVVREAQRTTPQNVAGTAVVPAIDLSLDDPIHISTLGLKRLGTRLAKVACREQFGQTNLERGPSVAEVALDQAQRTIRIRYADVNGSLSPARHISGFSVRNAEGQQLPLVYDAAVDPEDQNAVVLRLAGDVPPGSQLWYGYGLDPYCNLTDAEDMAAPTFGPWEIAPVE